MQQIPESALNHDGINVLKFISKGYYNIETYSDTIQFYDLRFGLLNGLKQEEEIKYTFSYIIDNSDPNIINIETKRPDAKLDIFKTIWKRIKGI